MSPAPLTARRSRSFRCPAILSLLAALIAVLGTASFGMVSSPSAGTDNWTPVHPGDFPDPSVLSHDGVYYAFATQNFATPSQTINIQVSTSADGVNWTPTGLDALPRVGSWAVAGETWAPSVAYDSTDNDFVMYYTATEASQPGDQCIGLATSANPLGPYVDGNPYPIVCQDTNTPPNTVGGDGGGSIDPDIFTDLSGNSWLIWKSDGNHLTPPMSALIWSVPLGPHLTPSTTSPTELLYDDASWQSGVVEGPDMVETPAPGGGDDYDLFYAGSDEGASTYGIGWASCGTSFPTGLCTDMSASGPLLGTEPGMSGPGGPDVFDLYGGQPVMAFAAWQGNTIGYLACGIRPMYLAEVNFGPGGTPQIVGRPRRRRTRRQPQLPGAATAPAWILAGRLGRGRLHLRLRRLLRIDRVHEAEQARRGDGGDARPPGLLAGGQRRRRVRLR